MLNNQIRNQNTEKITSNSMPNNKIFDLEERTALFGEEIIKFSQKIPKYPTTIPLISQLVRSATSVGANYLEADDLESRKDFIHKMSISRKESREAKHWLRMIAVDESNLKEEARKLWKEAQELNLIFSSIINKKIKTRFNYLEFWVFFRYSGLIIRAFKT